MKSKRKSNRKGKAKVKCDLTLARQTPFQRRLARLESFGARLAARRSIKFAMLADEAKEVVAWGIRNGMLQFSDDSNCRHGKTNTSSHHQNRKETENDSGIEK